MRKLHKITDFLKTNGKNKTKADIHNFYTILNVMLAVNFFLSFGSMSGCFDSI